MFSYRRNGLVQCAVYVDSVTKNIDPNAFRTRAFEKVTELELDMPLEALRNDSLEGLINMTSLILRNIKLRSFEKGAFRKLRLKILRIIKSDLNIEQISGLIATIPAETIKSLTISAHDRLMKVPNSLLSSFRNLESISMRFNKISSIENNSFPTCAKKIRYINLRGNQLKTLPYGLFPMEFLIDPCELLYLQKIEMNFSKRILKSSICFTPFNLRHQRLIDVDLCSSSPSQPIVNNIKCLSNGGIRTKSSLNQAKRIKLHQTNSDGETTLVVQLESHDYGLIILETMPFSGKNSFKFPKCIKSKINATVSIVLTQALKSNKTQIFCVMDIWKKTIDPFSCKSLSGFRKRNDEIWLTQHMKMLALIGLAVIYGGSIVFGIILAMILQKTKRNAERLSRIRGLEKSYNIYEQ